MERLILFVPLFMLVGCQAPATGFDPFAFGRPTRVPSPPTGVVGGASRAYGAPSASKPADIGTNQNGSTPTPRQGAYWRPSDGLGGENDTVRASANAGLAAKMPPNSVAHLTENEALDWRNPRNAAPTTSPYPSDSVPTIGHGNAPGLLPPQTGIAGSVTPPPRVRFRNEPDRRDLRVPPELAELQHPRVRQAAASSPAWEARYGDRGR